MSDAHDLQNGNVRNNAEDMGLQANSPDQLPAGAATQTVAVPPGGSIALPAGAELDQVFAQGEDLVIVLDDGSRIIVPEGALIYPQIVVGGQPLPPANLAALIISDDNEFEPAATTTSSGGNFAGDPGAIQDAFDIGDLLPYTELSRPLVEDQEIIPGLVDEEPEIAIEIDDSGVSVINAEDLVNEAGLPERGSEPEGTDAASNSETTYGYINFASPDGVDTIALNGVVIESVGQVFTSDLGELTITSIEPGRIGYDYVLFDNTLDAVSEDNFAVTITDTDGDMATATLRIGIIDDAPIAFDDAGTVPAASFGPIAGNVVDNDTPGADDFADDTVTGFGNAGGSAAPGDSLQGEYGVLTLNADGSYSYLRDFNTPGGVTDTFTYDIVDQDGSTDQAQLVITIEDAPDTIDFVPDTGEGTVVDEGGLPPRDGEPVGTGEGADGDPTNNDDMSETTGATVEFTSPDGVESVTINGVAIDPDSLPQTIVDDATGMLVITAYNYDPATGVGSITYEYTLGDNTSGDDTSVSFDFVVTDLDGDVAEDTLTIDIIDDEPEAADDSAGQVAENQSIVIDALANDTFGADNVDTSDAAKVFVSTQATQGTVTYDPATGLFTYVPNPGAGSDQNTSDSFQYTIIDGDGDPSVATVDITLQPDSEPQGSERVATVDDDGLTGGNAASTTGDIDANVDDDPADTSEASFTGALGFDVGNDGPAIISIDPALAGTTVQVGTETATYSIDGNVLTATGPRGVLFTVEITDSATGEYVVTLVDNVLHEAGSDENNAFVSIDFIVADSEGETTPTNLGIVFNDDAPTATDNSNDVVEGASTGGNLLTDDDGDGVDAAGADDYAAVGAVVGIASTNEGTSQTTVVGGELVIAGEFGTLTVNVATGAYSYVSDANSTNQDDQDVFTYTIRDGDGDESTATLTIDVDNVGGEATDDDVDVNEKGLPTGTGELADGNPSNESDQSEVDSDGQIMVTGAAPGSTLTYSLTGANSDGDGTYGTLVLNSATGEYTYTLDTRYDHDPVQGTNVENNAESFTYEVRDENNNLIAGGTIEVNITDDVPSVTASDPETELLVDETDLATDDTQSFASAFDVVAGADGQQSLAYTLAVVGGDGADSGLVDTATQNNVFLFLESGEVVGREGTDATDAATGEIVFTLSVDGSGDVTLDQQRAIVHSDSPDNHDEPETLANGLVTLTATVTDGDDDTASDFIDLGGNVTFEDDGPTAIVPDAIDNTSVDRLFNIVGETATADLDIDDDVSDNFGADGPGSITFANITDGDPAINETDLTALTHDGQPILLYVTDGGSTVEGRALVNGTPEVVFTIELNEAGSDYTVTMVRTIDDGSGAFFDDLSGGVAGNPPFKLVDAAGGEGPSIIFTPRTGGAGDPDGSINSDTDDLGANSQFITQGDGVSIDFGDFSYFANGGGTSDDAYTHDDDANINGFRFTIDQISNGTTVDVVLATYDYTGPGGSVGTPVFDAVQQQLPDSVNDYAQDPISSLIVYDDAGVFQFRAVFTGTEVELFDSDGLTVDGGGGATSASWAGVTVTTVVGGAVVVTDLSAQWSIETYTADNYDRIVIDNIGDGVGTDGKFSISELQIAQTNDGAPKNLVLDLEITDGDGDSLTLIDALDITFEPAAAMPPPPIVLDLDGGGNAFSSLDAGIAYDYDGDGVKTKTAWIAAGSAILAYDANSDGMVTDASEFVFGNSEMTDLEAVAARYDDNNDGVLDASDAAYGKFGVWLDSDLDGNSDEGEFVSLSDAGITSIDLVSDGVLTTEADGDVTVFGTSSFTMADGSTGEVSDAAFATGSELDAAMMEALLAGGEGEAQLAAQEEDVEAVLADALAESDVDALIDSYVEGDSGANASSEPSDAMLASFLDADVGMKVDDFAMVAPQDMLDDSSVAVIAAA